MHALIGLVTVLVVVHAFAAFRPFRIFKSMGLILRFGSHPAGPHVADGWPGPKNCAGFSSWSQVSLQKRFLRTAMDSTCNRN
jgi:hypothetical protein